MRSFNPQNDENMFGNSQMYKSKLNFHKHVIVLGHVWTMKYQLKCLKTGDVIDDQYTLHYTDNALLRAIYHHPLRAQ